MTVIYLVSIDPTDRDDGKLIAWSDAASEHVYVEPPVAGVELDYAEFTSVVNPTATSQATANTVVTGGSVAYDGSTAVVIEFYSQTVSPHNAAGADLTLWLFEDGVSIGKLGYVRSQAANFAYRPVLVRRRMTPSSGSHTYSIRAHVSTGTGVVAGGAGGAGADLPGYIRITRA